ncbi:hypothetical protein PFICI_13540 [Pestalotiopsis fici W106-1]|uniref:Uncharacterized protein n=1 Tax=Pestalotiopsis fici (strain W106-1 / CGMCC3.15140) TaxID=1229662 RepID=W3WQE9_PESFW|nr:uncharacterized protein PFICI_13540 [Pestalotiopsis fici W106-1]ETS75056.1 hypothetical protein PFICI_13540 [Pestalotiopsis fici W106-1]
MPRKRRSSLRSQLRSPSRYGTPNIFNPIRPKHAEAPALLETARKYFGKVELWADDFVGDVETTVTTRDVHACIAVIDAFSRAEKFIIDSKSWLTGESLNFTALSAARMLCILNQFKHGDSYRLTISGSGKVIRKGWIAINPVDVEIENNNPVKVRRLLYNQRSFRDEQYLQQGTPTPEPRHRPRTRSHTKKQKKRRSGRGI